ncbi:type IX secretion system membrane protein PorP/SprF [Aquimarina sp. MMG016]|uniref:PorP/SprF family type IX secretion system membrane protein n=1 Tax=Aquimarina sp. MMG016 TaxID=2822690 RepID=UPI001B3A3C24|nr:type IX secretion system membrane protein PorP/SprF [Aquimarina sp. MMG016]MBQ4822863.1 type IX secretion system membrane protein PorP/SprF [Aquimarina sp. MMG016]
MKSLNYIFFVLMLSFLVQTHAQQDPHFSMYRYNMNVITPAYAGTNQTLETLFSVRSQWVRVNGAPETFHFNINSPVGKNVGIGLNVITDRVFVLDETHVYADFSYKIKLAESLDLYAGVKAGGTFLNIDLLKLDVENDPLFSENVSSFNPNVGVGFYFKSEKYFITLSAPSLLSNDRYEKDGVNPVSADDDLQMFLGGGYEWYLSDAFKVVPSTLIKAVPGAPTSIDLTLSGTYKERLELGTNYRLDESITLFLTAARFLQGRLDFGYAYEFTTADTRRYNNGSHEVILKLRL